MFLFIAPIRFNGELTIPIAILAKLIQSNLKGHSSIIITSIVTFTAFMTIITKLFNPNFIKQNHFLYSLFNTTPLWFITKVLSGLFILMTYFQVGPEFIRSHATGALVLDNLLPVLFSIFICAGLFLPLLMNFGLLEFTGTLATRIMRPLFGLPGSSAVNCVTSWLGDGSVGILLTSKQYEAGVYTEREAAVISTNFSSVSITFCLVVIGQVRLEHMFGPFFFVVCLTGVITAMIVPRLPPLSFKKDIFIDSRSSNIQNERVPLKHNLLSYSLEQALHKSSQVTSLSCILKNGLKNVIDMIFGVLPVVMTIGTLALILAEYTRIFEYLGMPFIPFLKLLQIPEAEAASRTIIVGFADMFLPSILIANIQSEITRFIIAAMSVTQLIYMSEIGALLLGSKIPIKLWELFAVFILRTLVTLPIITLMAHLIF